MSVGLPDGRWVRAVPRPFISGLWGRLNAALAVLTGHAHAVAWPAPGALEGALVDPRVRRRPVTGDDVYFSMPITDGTFGPANHGILIRENGSYRDIMVYLNSQYDPILIERHESEVFLDPLSARVTRTPAEVEEFRRIIRTSL